MTNSMFRAVVDVCSEKHLGNDGEQDVNRHTKQGEGKMSGESRDESFDVFFVDYVSMFFQLKKMSWNSDAYKTREVDSGLSEMFGIDDGHSKSSSSNTTTKSSSKQQAIELKGTTEQMIAQLDEYLKKGVINRIQYEQFKKQITQ